jgi:hypothetical protein
MVIAFLFSFFVFSFWVCQDACMSYMGWIGWDGTGREGIDGMVGVVVIPDDDDRSFLSYEG